MHSLTNLRQWILFHSPHTGDGNWTNGPCIFPHDVILRKVVTGCEVVSGPLTRSAGRAGELISQVFMRLARCTDPAAVLTWKTEINESASVLFFLITLQFGVLLWQTETAPVSSPTCLHFLHLITFTGVAALRGWRHLSGPVNQLVV